MTDEGITDEVRAARDKVVAEAGSSPAEISGQIDYFGLEEVFKVMLPDGVSFFEHKLLTDGQRLRYLNKSNRGVTLKQRTNEATVETQPGTDRRELVKLALVGWNLSRGGSPVAFPTGSNAAAPGGEIDKVLDKLPPHIIDVLERDIREKNKWLRADVTVEDIDEEIENLQRMRAEVVEEQGKGSGSPTS